MIFFGISRISGDCERKWRKYDVWYMNIWSWEKQRFSWNHYCTKGILFIFINLSLNIQKNKNTGWKKSICRARFCVQHQCFVQLGWHPCFGQLEDQWWFGQQPIAHRWNHVGFGQLVWDPSLDRSMKHPSMPVFKNRIWKKDPVWEISDKFFPFNYLFYLREDDTRAN